MSRLSVLVDDYAKAEAALCRLVSPRIIDSAALKIAEARVEGLEYSILSYVPHTLTELLEKMNFVHTQVSTLCDQEPQISAMLSTLTKDVKSFMSIQPT